MSDINPFDQFDEAGAAAPVPAAAAPTPAPAPSSATATATANPFDQFDDHAGQAPAMPQESAQDKITAHYLNLLHDKNVTGQQIRQWFTDQKRNLSEDDSKVIDWRDAQIAQNGYAPTIGVKEADAGTKLPDLIDNRPYSFFQGVIDGGRHVLGNVAEGAQFVANNLGSGQLGLGDPNATFGDQAKGFYDRKSAEAEYQGNGVGNFVGEVATAAPVALLAPEGLLGAGIDGAAQGALTTHSTTLPGVAGDTAIGAGIAGVGGLAARAFGRIASTPTAATQRGTDVLDAGRRLSRDGLEVNPLPGDVGGGLARGLSAVADSGIVSNAPYGRGVDDYLSSVQQVRDRAANGLAPGNSTARDLNAVAGDVQSGVGGLGDYEQRSAERIGQQFDDVAEASRGINIPAPSTLNRVSDLIARAEAMPGESPRLPFLRAIRDDLTPTPDRVVRPSLLARMFGAQDRVVRGNPAEFTLDTLRRFRTSIGDNFDSNQRVGREIANELWPTLTQDMEEGLTNAGRQDLADAHRAANQAWAQRQTNLDEVVHPILGSRDQGQLADHLTHMSQSDWDGLNRALDLMSDDQAGHVRAALVQNLGRSKSGQQNAVGDAMSLNGFLTDWDKVAAGVKTQMLAGQAGQDLQDLATLAEAARISGRYRNTSGTARSADALGLLKTLGSTVSGPGGGFALGGIPGAAVGLAAQYGLGRAMASPTLARAGNAVARARLGSHAAQALGLLARHGGAAIHDETEN